MRRESGWERTAQNDWRTFIKSTPLALLLPPYTFLATLRLSSTHQPSGARRRPPSSLRLCLLPSVSHSVLHSPQPLHGKDLQPRIPSSRPGFDISWFYDLLWVSSVSSFEAFSAAWISPLKPLCTEATNICEHLLYTKHQATRTSRCSSWF